MTIEEKNKMWDLARKMERIKMTQATIMEALTTKIRTDKALRILKENPYMTENEFLKKMQIEE